MHSDEFSGARARIPQRVEDRYACAHKRARLRRRQFIGNHCQRGNWCDHVLGIPTVEVDAGDFSIDAHREVTTSALFAHKTMSTMPTYPHALPFCPSCDVVADRIDASGYFMTRDPGILKPGPQTFFDESVAVANAASLNSHAYLSRIRLRDIALSQL